MTRSLGDNRIVGGRGGGQRSQEADSLSRGQERLSWAQPRMLWGEAELSGNDNTIPVNTIPELGLAQDTLGPGRGLREPQYNTCKYNTWKYNT